MEIKDKFYKKYGTDAVIIPPPPEGEDSIDPSKSFPKNKISPFLSQFTLEEGEDGLDPSLFEEHEPEDLKWRQNILNQEVADDFEDTKKEIDLGSYKPPKAAPDEGTIPPGHPSKKASVDAILKSCHAYYVLSRKV